MDQSTGHRPGRRRITRAALKQQVLEHLAAALPEGWISQPLSPVRAARMACGASAVAPASVPAASAGDVLVISPRGRCHFLFVRAPADRWWDGGPHSVPAEAFSAQDEQLARQLRAAGHKARPIRCDRDLNRALAAWGCPFKTGANFSAPQRSPGAPAAAKHSPRPTLRLRSLGGQSNG